MNKYNPKVKYIKLEGRTVAALRGNLLDVQRHYNGFLKDERTQQIEAIAISQSVLHDGRKANIIRVTHLDTGEIFTISRADFDKYSYPWQNTVKPFEMQRACRVSRFAYTPAHGLNVPAPIEREPLPEWQQIGFGV